MKARILKDIIEKAVYPPYKDMSLKYVDDNIKN